MIRSVNPHERAFFRFQNDPRPVFPAAADPGTAGNGGIHRIPKTMAELMVIPQEFGVCPEDRLDITVRSMEEVVCVSRQVQNFCQEKGIDDRRSYFAALMVEEMAGNIVSHGFRKDSKRHSADLRIAYKNQSLILRIKDDCIPFDPSERRKIVDPDDITKNIGVRMVFSLTQDIQYQNILGMNALTIRI